MTKKKAVTKHKNLADDTSFWIIIIAVLILLLVGLVFYWIKVFTDENYFNYDGKGGEYKITRSKVADVIFYHISVFADGREYIYSFRNHPEDLEDIYLEPNLDIKLNRPGGISRLYVTKDVELHNMTNGRSVIATAAFEQILSDSDVSLYNLNVSNAFTSFYDESSFVITCSNITDTAAVVYLKLGDETKVYSEDDCIIIQGKGKDGLISAGEKFAYYLLGVF